MGRDIWISLFIFGVILFTWPILSLFRYSLSLYLFIAWLVFIALIIVASVKTKKEKDGG